jgi:hypothetical protein
MLRLLLILLISSPALFTGDPQVESQSAGFEIDHFFVAVPGPESGSAALEGAGFQAGPSNTHPGQGTASRGILFENAYLELIWLTDRTEAVSPPIERTRLGDRMDPESEACPFGIGLRRKGELDAALPFESWDYRPPYLPEGLSFQMSVSSEQLGEPLVFYLPWLSAPVWPAPEHRNGARRVTRLEIVLEEQTLDSETISAISETGLASFRTGAEFFMDVELDEAGAGGSLDLRPDVPLRIRW